MRILNTELLVPTAEEIRNLVLMAYDAGRTRGREEARLELRGLLESSAAPAIPSNISNDRRLASAPRAIIGTRRSAAAMVPER